MSTLTPRLAQCYSFIGAYCLEHGYSPSLQEIAAHMGLAGRSSAIRLIEELEERGLVRRIPNRSRNVEVIEQRGADFHLKRILNELAESGLVLSDDAIVAEAREFIGRAA